MGKKPKIRITLVDKKSNGYCSHGHKYGDTFDFDTERGKLCPLAMHALFPMINILRYGGRLPGDDGNSGLYCCPDANIINIFKVEKIEDI
ncbi:TIGR04076 family protein [Clostridium sp. MSJ-11]|uniref:TIGR04076 family protein n=1 Tax=Clostridium mobile TaxID=2841512 RepID=A0ABS6EMH7_9CLOT|nr:TIGR04076 family protein [Clostridium mobile]MBU5485620.1 TIGR04076 family protein [Clostridium mobile]